jgi:TPR repeat protein
MAIRTVTQGFSAILRRPGAIRPWRAWIAVGAMALLLSSTASADYAAGLAAFNRKDFGHAFSEWIESAKAGDAHAQHGLGMLYEMGQGVPHADPKAAAEWYQKAAAQNYPPALNNLARLYADGRGVQKDVPKAIEMWSRAAEAGNATARFNLGLQYTTGSGVPKDMKKAADHLLQAAESGLPEAQFAIAGLYRDGTGVEKDLQAARQWFDRAAAAGFEPARKELASLDKASDAAASKPAGDNTEATPAAPTGDQQAQAQKTPSPPPAPDSTEANTPEKPAEGEAQETPPTETQQATTPPAEQTPPPEAPKMPEASSEAPPAPAPAEEGTQPSADAAAPEQQASKQEQPAAEGAAAVNPPQPDSDLPVAESVADDTKVYRIWLYESGQEGDARSYWEKLNQQYPLLKRLQLDLRRYFLGEAKGSLYRVFAGPFDDLGAAQKACEDIKRRFGDQFCRPVLN